MVRKHNKLVATISAAAFLAIGASMTSFAAAGWTEENGQWFYYENDGTKAEDTWKKSGENWYWLDGEQDGAMAIEKLVEDDDDLYYVNGDGAMVKNTWVKVENEEQDEVEDPAEFHYYYMQANGKAYKAGDSGKTKFKTIDGKRYAFDTDGKMLYGWVNGDSERLTDDDAWNANEADEDIYYLGNWDDGSMKTGWQKLTVYDAETEEDEEYWFWFKSNGKKYTAEAGSDVKLNKTINGKKYGFDERGVMAHTWTLADESVMNATSSNWRYFSSPEDGARVSKGWFKAAAPNDAIENTFKDYGKTFAAKDADDETEHWYYADKDGELYQGEIKKIGGSYYGFWPEKDELGRDTGKGGAMLTGLCALKVNDGKIVKVYEENMDINDMLDCLNADDEKYLGMHIPGSGASLYYFGNDADTDGAMRTGISTVYVSGLPLTFEFSKSGGANDRGKGITGVKDGKYIYKFGYKMTADADEKYKLFYATGSVKDDDSIVFSVDTTLLRGEKTEAENKNKDGQTVRYVGTMNGSGLPWETNDNVYYLINTSGRIVEDKQAVQDGYDWYYYVDDKEVKMYTDNKVLKGDDGEHPLDVNGAELKTVWKTDADVCSDATEEGLNVTPSIGEIMKYSGDRSELLMMLAAIEGAYELEDEEPGSIDAMNKYLSSLFE